LPDQFRRELETKLSHKFANPNLFWEALQAHGNGVEKIGERKTEDGNKKTAMLGDSVIQLAILNKWLESETSRSRHSSHT
jgi:ribonuclease-3